MGFENPNEEARYQAYKARLLEELGEKPFIQAKVVVINGKPWHESASGIEAKGKELNIERGKDEGSPQYYDRVLSAAGLKHD